MQSSEIGGIRTTCGDPRLYQRDYRAGAEEESKLAVAKDHQLPLVPLLGDRKAYGPRISRGRFLLQQRVRLGGSTRGAEAARFSGDQRMAERESARRDSWSQHRRALRPTACARRDVGRGTGRNSSADDWAYSSADVEAVLGVRICILPRDKSGPRVWQLNSKPVFTPLGSHSRPRS